MNVIRIDDRYDVLIENNLIHSLTTILPRYFIGSKLVVVTDRIVVSLYHSIVEQLKSMYDVKLIVVEEGEQSKQLSTVTSIYDQLIDYEITRYDGIVALGGGVIGDLVGFVASTYMRGICYIQIPTTLLSQVDSSVGSKVAIDYKGTKNLMGSFYDPICVLIDPVVLQTLPNEYLKDGLAEVLKYAFIDDLQLYTLLQQHNINTILDCIEEVIVLCVCCKKRFVEEDRFDKGKRMLLNFGHTIGHAIESYYDYKTYRHGSAVAIGMNLISIISEKKKQSNQGVSNKVISLLKQYNLLFDFDLEMKDLVEYLLKDKKREDDLFHFIVLEDLGHAVIYKDSISYLM